MHNAYVWLVGAAAFYVLFAFALYAGAYDAVTWRSNQWARTALLSIVMFAFCMFMALGSLAATLV